MIWLLDEDINYNQQQILLSLTSIKIKDIDYKALQFYKDDFNISYLFPDGNLDGLEHNQIFIFYSGKINLYEDYFTFSDDSVGNIICAYDNIKNVEYLEERNYTVILIKFNDMDRLSFILISLNQSIKMKSKVLLQMKIF